MNRGSNIGKGMDLSISHFNELYNGIGSMRDIYLEVSHSHNHEEHVIKEPLHPMQKVGRDQYIRCATQVDALV